MLGALVGEETWTFASSSSGDIVAFSSSGDVGILSWGQQLPWYGLSFFVLVVVAQLTLGYFRENTLKTR